ncbi:hypothetical protein [Arcobacter ellisii]|uniref:Uncharacterized protein n=1 Tax=Arcobacter ellisii TaxID=913109 RepID=A0A347U8B8_9BACT|nr:hypothetical protein [Arcobacter ellisii]AXX95096.1 hypothetical protein AELL_1434 [Arcobacter ellisii]RXI28986.1 hypothetical protein CP962_12255 [Arcobacter ellisii]
MKQTEKYKMRFGASIMGDTDYIMIRNEFLKSKKVFSRFKKLEKAEGFSWYEVENARQLITTFNWKNTSEGYSYWNKIHTEWLEYIGIFGKYNNLKQYETALEKVAVFKSLLSEIDKDGFDAFLSAFITDNEDLELFINDTLLKTFLGGYSNSSVIKIWLDDYHLEQDYWKNILEKMKKIDFLMYELDNNPTLKASFLRTIPLDELFSEDDLCN